MSPDQQDENSSCIEPNVDRICASEGFRRSARLQRFLRYLASTQAAVGRGPKEYEIAREVYDKPQDFNPQTDPIVRVEASRLRLRLAEYYQGPGRDDPATIELPKGSYSLLYRARTGRSVQQVEGTGARNHYLRGRYFWSRRTAESIQQAIACFRKAIDEDCFDSAAWSGLADCYLVMGSFEYMRPDIVLPRAIAAARRALELNPSSAEAHSSLAAATGFYTWDADAAFAGFERALALDPGYASAWHFYGVVLFGRGLHQKSLHALNRALDLDPLSPIFAVQVASLYYLMRDFRHAARLCDDLIRLEPEFWPARWFGGMSLEGQGRTSEAKRYLESAVEMSNRSHYPLAALAHLEASMGQPEQATVIAEELEHRRQSEHCSAAAVGLVHLGLDHHDTALQWLRTALQERSPFCAMFLTGDPRLDPLRSRSDFQQIADAFQQNRV